MSNSYSYNRFKPITKLVINLIHILQNEKGVLYYFK